MPGSHHPFSHFHIGPDRVDTYHEMLSEAKQQLQRRIEAHICIAFVAYKVYKELERQLKEKQSPLSSKKAIAIAKVIYAIKIKHPVTSHITCNTIIKTEQQKNLATLFAL